MKKIKLSAKNSFVLYPKKPFNFNGTFHKPSHFQNNLSMDYWKKNFYWQTFTFNKELFGLRINNKGKINKPKIKIAIFSSERLDEEKLELLKKEIIYRFELNIDLSEFNDLCKKDKKFYPVFKKWIGMRNSNQYSLYELIIVSIVLQNANVRRSIQMLDSLLDKYGIKVLFDNKKLYSIWLSENLENVSEQELRDLKVGYRAKFIKRLSHDFVEGEIDEEKLKNLKKDEAREELMKLYGIGPETARILLSEVLHHYDAFDHIAPWQQKIYSMLFYNKHLVPVSKISKDIKKRYIKYSMLAVHYIMEDIFWKRKNEHIEWLEREIRL